ncbi:MAG: nucleotidyl transferase AbiEii/AbiGii toxin family protein [Candidatus Liptonbacteria bacterium]|nr:nucleotidyl transferase AbiEii/AbiGii toxin family protein [Candidatus Liptonbacteria bacterium]
MHLDALTKQGKLLFPLLAKFKHFYLAGGTAVALQIGHRISVDFDLFTPRKLSKNLLPLAEKIFGRGAVRPLVNNSDQLTVSIRGVALTFLYYPFPVVRALVKAGGQRMLDVPELAATKVYTIGRRGTLKDYVDIYFILCEQHTSLADIITLAERKYGASFNARLFLEQLVYLHDIPKAPLRFLKKPVAKAHLEKFFESEVKKIVI